MKDYGFTIKVSDILKNPSTNDLVSLEKKFSTNIPQLSEDGISAKLFIQGLNDDQISISIEDCSCEIETNCDKCGKEFRKQLKHSGTDIKVYKEGVLGKSQELNEEISISKRTETIDVENFLVSLLLSDSVVNLCTDCQKLPVEDDQINEVKNGIVRK